MKILFLSANPPGSARLELEEEVSKIEEGLQRSKLNGHFELVTKWAVDSNALRRALLEENPDIVHFSGHGEGQTGLVLVGQNGQAKPATGEALSGLFKQFPNIKCVLLNACYAEVQAKAIVQHINYVVGMKQAVRDDAAIAFATGFYDGLGYGKSIEVAFELGCNAVQFELASFSATTRSRKLIPVDFTDVQPLPDHLIPVLLKRETGSSRSFTRPISSSKANSLSEELRTKDESTKANALRIYRERVQEFLADRKLTQIEKFQLAILANVVGLSEADANRVLQEEQDKQHYPVQPVANHRSWFTRIDNTKKYLFVCAALLLAAAGGFVFYKQSNKYAHLQGLLEAEEWIAADQETAQIMRKIAGKKIVGKYEEISLGVEDFKKIPCSDLQKINDLWERYSKNQFGFGVQKRIWQSNDVNSDLGNFMLKVGWLKRERDGNYSYVLVENQSINLSAPAGKLPWAVTYPNGNDDTRKSYIASLVSCLP